MTQITIKVENSGLFEKPVHDAIKKFLTRYGYGGTVADADAAEFTRAIQRAVLPGRHLMESHEDGCADRKENRACMICDGGLQNCVICGGAEGSLTTMCPGYKIDQLRIDEIAKLTLDYTDKGWTNCAPVLFHNSLRPVPLWHGVPKLEGYEIVFCPGHDRSEWVAEKLPERKPPLSADYGKLLAEQDTALNGVN